MKYLIIKIYIKCDSIAKAFTDNKVIRKEIAYNLIPIKSNRSQPRIANFDVHARILNDLADRSSFALKEAIQNGVISFPRPIVR